MTESTSRTVIVGGGIAGAATAYMLASRGVRNVVILEREYIPGAHSTGRNAAILRSLIPDPVLRGIARESASFYRDPPESFSEHPLLNPVGLFLVARENHAAELLACLGDGNEMGAPTQVSPGALYERIPYLARGLTAVLFQPDEGVLDVHGILQSFLTGASCHGAALMTSCEARKLITRNGAVEGIETATGFLAAGRVVLAGGGWAVRLASDAGFPLPIAPFRRHLLVTEPLPQVKREWPVVWILGDEFYFRPESGGLLLCGCDTVPVPPDQGEQTDPHQIEGIAAKTACWLPELSAARVARAWAGMRTFAPDHRFLLGPDPRVKGMYWAAALGGHGITCAPIAGSIVADWIVNGSSAHPAAAACSPQRLLR